MKSFHGATVLTVAILALTCRGAAGIGSLFISEYGEGSSGHNKYIEIYNPFGAVEDLSKYRVWLISNGGYWPESEIALSGSVGPGDVFVVCNDKADSEITVHADLRSSKLSHDGNNAVGLAVTNAAGGWILLDAVGRDGTNYPAVGWDVAGTPAATKDHTLVRKDDIAVGTTNWTLSAGSDTTNSQWIVLPADTVSGLGFHGTAPEQPPFILAAETAVTVRVNSPLSYFITVNDFNGDTITLTVSDAPAGVVFTPPLDQVGAPILTNRLSWTPAATGDYDITYTATDNDGSTTSTVSIHVSGDLPPPERVWINEIHYDNIGTDTNEGVEVAGRAGLSLDAYRLVLYNGSSGAQYGMSALTGLVIDNAGTGYGTVWRGWPVNGLQNGAPDGIALVEVAGAETNVIQFLSYTGSFTATDGPAAGLPSTDIGVQESATSTPVGHSLQLTGKGNRYADFTWAGPMAHTRGDVNQDQLFVPEPSVLIMR